MKVYIIINRRIKIIFIIIDFVYVYIYIRVTCNIINYKKNNYYEYSGVN